MVPSNREAGGDHNDRQSTRPGLRSSALVAITTSYNIQGNEDGLQTKLLIAMQT